jgi:RNA polymerase sigma-70 factor (ECF subfamily)
VQVIALAPPIAPDFGELCLPLQSSLLARAFHLTRERESARDLVQDTLLYGMLAWGSFRAEDGKQPEDCASAWLHRILFNQFISRCRVAKRQAVATAGRASEVISGTVAGASGEISVTNQPTDVRDGRSGEAIAAEIPEQRFSPAVMAALESLDEDALEVVVRVDIRGETYREITDALGIPIGTVKSRLNRARGRLAEILRCADRLPPPREP